MSDLHNRRAFIRAAMAAGAAWAAADVTQVDSALAWASQQSSAGGVSATTALTKAQADVVDAVASRIIPAVDGRSGAHEAGAVYFIDRALATFNAAQKTMYLGGIADVNRRALALAPGVSGFAALSTAQQDQVLKQIETTPFFQMARFDVIVGTFALPTWGGNRDFTGWHLLGFDHQPRFQAPFGYYDADVNRRA
jgi:gluconate 2-dehydrogenase gamma chain